MNIPVEAQPDPSEAVLPTAPTVSTIPAEARAFQGQRAGIVTRFVANAIDVAVVVGILLSCYAAVVVTVFVLNPRNFTIPDLPQVVGILLIGLWVQGSYFTVCWATTGRTYGDHLMGLRVVNWRGGRVHFVGAAVRATICVLFPIGLFWIVVSKGNRSIQDVALRTSVIYDWTARTAAS